MMYAVGSFPAPGDRPSNNSPQGSDVNSLEFAYRRFGRCVALLLKSDIADEQKRRLRILANAPTILQFDPDQRIDVARFRAMNITVKTLSRAYQDVYSHRLLSDSGVLVPEISTAWWLLGKVIVDLLAQGNAQLEVPSKIFGASSSVSIKHPELTSAQRRAFSAFPRALSLEGPSAQAELRTTLSNLQHLADYMVKALTDSDIRFSDKRNEAMLLGEGRLVANGAIGVIGRYNQHLHILTPLGMLPVCSVSTTDYYKALQIFAPLLTFKLRTPRIDENFHILGIECLPCGPTLPDLKFAGSDANGNISALGNLWNKCRPENRSAHEFEMGNLKTAPSERERISFISWPSLDGSFATWNGYFIGVQRLCDYLVRYLREREIIFADCRTQPLHLFSTVASENGGLGFLAYKRGQIYFLTPLGLLPVVSVVESQSAQVLNSFSSFLGLRLVSSGISATHWPEHGIADLYAVNQLPGNVPIPLFNFRTLSYGHFEREFSIIWAKHAPSERRRSS